MELSAETQVGELSGIGAVRVKALAKLGITTVRELLEHYPRDYEDRRMVCTIADAPTDRAVCISAIVAEPPHTARIRKGLDISRVRVVDGSAAMTLTFFNQSYVRDALTTGASYVFYGRVEGDGRARHMTNPQFERVSEQRLTGCILPIYPLTAGLSNPLMVRWIRQTIQTVEEWEDVLPEEVRRAHDLPDIQTAVKDIHFPKDHECLERAKRRMIFEELFLLTAGLRMLKTRRDRASGIRFSHYGREEFCTLLPFEPTGAQKRIMDEIGNDVSTGMPMNRLVQGDVGSGKTAVAAYAAWLTWKNGGQSALMVPTEILAEQHYRSLSTMLAPAGMRVALLSGAVKGAARKTLLLEIERGAYDLIVGTHALLSSGVRYARLQLVVADEQHRFGVAQRAALAAKGAEGAVHPHVLVMSATPIPRTLALIIYGDLDVSVLDELPPGRTPVGTYLVGEDKRTRMYGFVRKLVQEGRQAYIVCPAVEEGEPQLGGGMDLKAVTRYARELQENVFPDLRIGLVHGRLKAKEKDAVMAAFAAGELDVLVSTTVIEVGVDVPNAALMIVENAERFGLSQLHQLRGRVGRGTWQSHCVLMTNTRNAESRARLKVMTATTDGFRIAEEDLKLRGPGDFFGARQHGLPTLRVANLAGDLLLLQEAQNAAQTLLANDPTLTAPNHRLLRQRVQRLFAENPDIFN